MTNYSNLKLEFNEKQPLDEIVKELKRIGLYVGFIEKGDLWISARHETKLIVSFENESNLPDSHWRLTTIAELKEM